MGHSRLKGCEKLGYSRYDNKTQSDDNGNIKAGMRDVIDGITEEI